MNRHLTFIGVEIVVHDIYSSNSIFPLSRPCAPSGGHYLLYPRVTMQQPDFLYHRSAGVDGCGQSSRQEQLP